MNDESTMDVAIVATETKMMATGVETMTMRGTTTITIESENVIEIEILDRGRLRREVLKET
ncbi:hypothetical protein N0V90_010798 [Kalmusia sp. IMI 367209]|nr:hypothetical protein N0V90_010798 [Kalmusia sp. IMI 367209]